MGLQSTAEALVRDARAVDQVAGNHVYTGSDYRGSAIRYASRASTDALVLASHPWVDEENLAHVYSQSCYYAWHG